MATNFDYDDWLDQVLRVKNETDKNSDRADRVNEFEDGGALLELIKSPIHELKNEERKLIQKL